MCMQSTFVTPTPGAQAATTLLWTYTSASPMVNEFYFANQRRAQGIRSIARATLGFNVDVCWYLDSSFCSGLHSLKSIMGATEILDLVRWASPVFACS